MAILNDRDHGTLDEQVDYLTKGCVDVVRLSDLQAKLKRSAKVGKPLTVKVGFDPTAPDLHLGHTVLIRKMKHFQDLGHTVIFVVGDFTALIGDPAGRTKTRPPLTEEEILENSETYKTQVFKLLDREKTVVKNNSKWLKKLGSEGWIRLAAHYSVAQMLERRDFKKRYDKGQPIAIHEFLYPLAQAYDSICLEADVEMGGTDQLFNLNVGRDIMPAHGLEPQIVLTVPLLVGLDGVEKMAKSANNAIGITESPHEMFGKLMSISDDLMWTYYELLTDVSLKDIQQLQSAVKKGSKHPKEVKINLAVKIVTDFHSAVFAAAAAEEFERRFARKELPMDAPEQTVSFDVTRPRLSSLMVDLGFVASSSSATRVIDQGGVKIDGERILDKWYEFDSSSKSFILQVGKKARRVTLKPQNGD